MQPLSPSNVPSGAMSFNPHRFRGAGATILIAFHVSLPNLFQSSPVPRSRCNVDTHNALDDVLHVSILTGSEEPVQRKIDFVDSRTASKFQSSPVPRSRCNTGAGAPTATGTCFNPHRFRGAGATQGVQAMKFTIYGFQSSPVPRSRCNLGILR